MEDIMDEIGRENNREALQVLHVMSYFGPGDIRTGIFTPLFSNPENLNRVFNLLNRYSLVEFVTGETVVRINEATQTAVRKYLKDKNMENTALELAVRLLSANLTDVDNFYHAMTVFEYSKEHADNVHLIEDATGMGSRVIIGLMKLARYSETKEFGFKVFDFAKRILGEYHSATLCIQHNLGTLLGSEGKFEEALDLLLPLYEKDVGFSNQSEVIDTLVTIARSLSESSRYAEALPYYDRLLRNRKVADTNNETLLTAFHDYGLLLNDLDLTDKALEILRNVLEKRRKVLNIVDDDTRLTMSSIAHVYLKKGETREALSIFQQVYDERLVYLGDMHGDTLRTKRDIAVVLMNQGDHDGAFNLLSDVVPKFEKVLGEEHPDTLAALANLATTHSLRSELDDAYRMLLDVYEKQRRVLGEDQIETLRVKHNIGSVLLKQGKSAHALKVLKEVLTGFQRVFGPDHPETLNVQSEISLLSLSNLFFRSSLTTNVVPDTIHSHSRDGNASEVYSLIRSGENVNAKDAEGYSPLHYAAESGHVQVVKLLLGNGAAYDAKNRQGKTPLELTRRREIEDILSAVKSMFEDAKSGNHENIRDEPRFGWELIVNVKDATGHTPLHWAVFKGHQRILVWLLEHGADATLVSNKDNSPLHLAASQGNNEMVRILLQSVRPADLSGFINGQTRAGGTTALHVAAERGSVDVVRTLLENGAAHDIRNKAEKSPLDLAKDQNVRKLLELIDSLFADAKNKNADIVDKLKAVDPGDLLAIKKVRNIEKHSLLQIVTKNKNKEVTQKVLEALNEGSPN